MESQLNLKGEMKSRYSEMVSEVDRLRTKVSLLNLRFVWLWCYYFSTLCEALPVFLVMLMICFPWLYF